MRISQAILHLPLLATLVTLGGALANASPLNINSQQPILDHPTAASSRNATETLFYELEELARLVDIAYCVGTTGIYHPFSCASRCGDFAGFELIEVSLPAPAL